MTATAEQVSTLLHEAGEMPTLLGTKPVRSELVYLLVSLDKEYSARQPAEPWEAYYAQRVLTHFSPPES